LACLGLLASGFANALPPAARILISLSVLTWIPGAALLEIGFRMRRLSPVFWSLFSTVAGLALVSVIFWVGALVGLSFHVCATVVQVLLAFLFAADIWQGRRVRGVQREDKVRLSLAGGGGEWVVMAVAAAFALWAALYPPRPDFGQDAFDHIGYVRRVQFDDTIFPEGVLARPVGAEEPRLDPRKGTFHPVLALAGGLGGVDPWSVWESLPVLFFPLAFLAFLGFCAPFVPRGGLLVGCAALFAMFQGGIGFDYAREVGYGHNLALVFYWVLVPLMLRYLKGEGWDLLGLVVLLVAGGSLLHLGVLLHAAVAMATLIVFHRWIGFRWRALLRLCVAVAVAGVVVGVWKVAVSQGTANVIHSHPQGLLYTGGRWFVLSPFEILRQNGLPFLGGLVLIPLLALGCRGNRVPKLHVAFAAIPYVVCFCPPVATFLYDGMSYMAFRALQNVPVFAALVFTIWLLVRWARARGVGARVMVAVVLLLWSSMFLSPALSALGRAAAARDGASVPPREQFADLLGYLETLPGNTVVLSDPKTSYLVSAVTDHRVVAVFGQHGNPMDGFALDRLVAVRNVLSPFMAGEEAIDACDRYDVDVVVCNGRMGREQGDFLFDWDAAFYHAARRKFSALPSSFRPVFESRDITVYAYTKTRRSTEEWFPESTAVSFDGAGLEQCRVASAGQGFEIASVRVSPDLVVSGETLEFGIGYEMYDAHAYDLPVLVHIRLDHETIGEGEYPGEKYVRRFIERRSGRIRRFRVDHRPFGGLFAVDCWPVAVPFYERFRAKLPPGMAVGIYSVEFRVVQETLLPNFTVRDLLYNRDHYSGQACATLRVATQVER